MRTPFGAGPSISTTTLTPMLLALASRDAAILDEGLPASITGGTAGGGGEAALAFLGEALAARIESMLPGRLA